MPRVSLGLLLLALLLVLVGAGCEGANWDGPPSIREVRVNPQLLRFTGGGVTIRTWVRGSRGDATGVKAILEQGHDPQFLASGHTAAHFRDTTWRPSVFLGGDTYDHWVADGGRTEIDAAREHALELWRREPRLVVSETCHMAMLDVIERASRAL